MNLVPARLPARLRARGQAGRRAGRAPGAAVVAAFDPVTPLWRGLALFRVLTFALVVGLQLVYVDDYARPVLSWFVVGAVGVWTVVTVLALRTERGRCLALAVLDVVITLTLLASTRLVQTSQQIADTTPTVTSLWTAAPVVTVAVLFGPRLGAGTGALVAAASIAVNGHVSGAIARDSMILLLLGLVLGVVADAGRNAHDVLERALRTEAALLERERLARAVHDSVLQVLAFVRREGTALGGHAAELARMAGDQETTLRALITAAPEPVGGGAATDLSGLLQSQAGTSPPTSVSVPPVPVLLPAHVAHEVAAVVRAALSNTAMHAGAGASAWVLVEDLGDEVVVTVRDDGVGIADGRLTRARAQGRLGVSRSIRGRVAELGGRLELVTAPGEGTEWEITLPRTTRPRPGNPGVDDGGRTARHG